MDLGEKSNELEQNKIICFRLVVLHNPLAAFARSRDYWLEVRRLVGMCYTYA